MADITSIVASVAITVTLQSVFYALIKYPPIFRQETQGLMKATRDFTSVTDENNSALAMTGDAIDLLSSANDFLLGSSSISSEDLLERLTVEHSKLRGLESSKEPLKTYVKFIEDGLVRTISVMQNSSSREQIRRELKSIAWTNKISLSIVMRRVDEDRHLLADNLEVRASNLEASTWQFRGAALLVVFIIMSGSSYLLYLAHSQRVIRTSFTLAIWWAFACGCSALITFAEKLAKVASSITESTKAHIEGTRNQ